MTPVEVGLLTALVGVVGLGGGRFIGNGKRVTKSLCKERMDSARDLLEAEYKAIKQSLIRIENKIDKQNNKS